jgi:hypothetical protein
MTGRTLLDNASAQRTPVFSPCVRTASRSVSMAPTGTGADFVHALRAA